MEVTTLLTYQSFKSFRCLSTRLLARLLLASDISIEILSRWRPQSIETEVIKLRQRREIFRENGKFPTCSEKNVNIGNASCASLGRSIGNLWLSMMESWPMIMVSTLFGFRCNCFDSMIYSNALTSIRIRAKHKMFLIRNEIICEWENGRAPSH